MKKKFYFTYLILSITNSDVCVNLLQPNQQENSETRLLGEQKNFWLRFLTEILQKVLCSMENKKNQTSKDLLNKDIKELEQKLQEMKINEEKNSPFLFGKDYEKQIKELEEKLRSMKINEQHLSIGQLDPKSIIEDLKNKFKEFKTDIFVLLCNNEQQELSITIFDQNSESFLNFNTIQGVSRKDPIMLTSAVFLKQKKTFEEIKEQIKRKDAFYYDDKYVCVSGHVFLSSFTEVRIIIDQEKKRPLEPMKIMDMYFSRIIKNEEIEIEDHFLKTLTQLFENSFYESFRNFSSEKKEKYKDYRLYLSISEGIFKKKLVKQEDWKKSIVLEKEISDLYENFSCFLFHTGPFFFLKNGNFPIEDKRAFVNFTNFDESIALQIEEKTKQNPEFLSILHKKQEAKKDKNRNSSLVLIDLFCSFDRESFNIRKVIIDNNMLTEKEILEIINKA